MTADQPEPKMDKSSKKVQYLVVDTSAFIKNTQLQEVGEKIVTIEEVVNEIKSKRQLRRLVVLPYDLTLKDVFPENVNFVTEFSKKTGDYGSLSATDLKVMALTYQLEKEVAGSVDHLRTQPAPPNAVELENHSMAKPTDIAGFYLPQGRESEEFDESDEEGESEEEVEEGGEGKGVEGLTNELEGLTCEDVFRKVEGDDESGISEGDEEDDDDDDDDDDEGWITPGNVSEAKKDISQGDLEEKSVSVACLTTDFAMQNVLKQIGLNVVSLDGLLINQVRTYIFRCYSCFKTTSVMSKVFCPKCGNKTLKRVAVTVDRDGNQRIHINLRRPLTGRGKRFSLPKPQGGKYAVNPVLCEDQRLPDQRVTRLAKTKNDPLDPDYIAGYSPFVMRDVNSKSVMLGLHRKGDFKYWMRKNPNEVMKNRKKK